MHHFFVMFPIYHMLKFSQHYIFHHKWLLGSSSPNRESRWILLKFKIFLNFHHHRLDNSYNASKGRQTSYANFFLTMLHKHMASCTCYGKVSPSNHMIMLNSILMPSNKHSLKHHWFHHLISIWTLSFMSHLHP